MSDIGVKLGVEGEAQFKKALGEINTSLKTLGTEMKAVTSAFDKNDTSASKLAAQNQVLNKQIDEQKNKLEMLKARLAESAKEYGENDAKTQKWQQAVNLATADLNKMERQLDTNNKGLDDAAKASDKAGDAIDEAGDSADKGGRKFEKLGGVLRGIGVGMAAVAAAAGAAAVALGKQVVSAYADYEQLVGGVDTLFKDSSLALQDYANNAYKTAGLSANDYMETVTSFSASLIQSLGGDTEAAVKYADMAITDMSDNANKMGTDMASIQNAYQGFAKGTFTMLDNLKLGYGGTKSEMERLLADAGKISGFKYDVSSYADIVDAIHVVQTEMGITGTTALEAEETITGSVNAMKSAWQNWLVGLGNSKADMTRLTQNLVDGFRNIVKNITPVIENIVRALPEALNAIFPAIAALLPVLLATVTDLFGQMIGATVRLLPDLIPVAAGAMLTIVDALIDNLPLLISAAMVLITSLAGGIIDALPELIPAVVDTVAAIVETLIDNIDMLIDASIEIIMALADGLITSLPILILKAPEIIMKLASAIITNAPKLLGAAAELIAKLAAGLVNGFVEILGKVGGWVDDNLLQPIKDKVVGFFTVGQDLLKGLWAGINDKVAWLKTQVKSVVDKIKSWFTGKDGFDEHSPSKWAAGVGEYVNAGLAAGLTRSVGKVTDAAKKVKAALVDEEKRLQSELGKLKDKTAKTDEQLLEESLNAQLKLVQDYQKQYNDAIAEVQKSQDNMANKLASFGELFTRTETQFGDKMELGYLREHIQSINAYGDALDKLKARGASGSLLDEIKGLNVDDAIDYTDRLLALTDAEYEEYMALWEEKQAAAQRVAQDFYQSEMDGLKTEFVDQIPQELDGIKEEMRDLGVLSGRGLAQGFASQAGYIKNTFVSVLNNALSAAKDAMEIHSPSRKWAEVGQNMAAGIGVGFASQMRDVRRQINASIPTGFDGPSAVRAVEGAVNGMAALVGGQGGGTYIIQTVLDGRVIAETVFDPLKSVARQRGVAFV